MDVRMFTVGPVAENSFLIRRDGADSALLVDPGEEAPKLLGAIEALGVKLDAILLTHTHFDHVGAVAPVAKATGAPVYCPELEVAVLQDIMAYVPWPGFGPFESWDPEHTVKGGETLELAGLKLDVLFT
ncbi:MAG: hydroxyacylglutathione hydrolase, partial [Baekduia sp.]|nr:hydroxyacylglutathione hydrolase [Baekduia sp.]